MKRHFYKELLLLIVLTVVTSSARARPAPKPKFILILFGDSLTDTGNTLPTGGVPDPNLYTDSKGVIKGRYTNGLNWVDYLNATIARQYPIKIYNYAYGGATACSSVVSDFLPYIKDLNTQTELFLADVKSGKIKKDADTRVLVIQWIGSNDYLLALSDLLATGNPPPDKLAELVRNTTACRVNQLRTLATLTGLVSHIALLPLPPLRTANDLPTELKPVVKAIEDVAGASLVAAVASLQAAFNSAPRGSPGAGVNLYTIGDTASWIVRLMGQVQPPFKYTDVPCFFNENSPVILTPGLKACDNPFDHLFYDAGHPSSRFHEWFAIKGLLPRLQNLRLLPDSL